MDQLNPCPFAECLYSGTQLEVRRHVWDHHRRDSQHGGGIPGLLDVYPFHEIHAFRGFLRTYRHRIVDDSSVLTPDDYFEVYSEQIHKIMKNATKRGRSIKCQLTLVVIFYRGEITDQDYEEVTRYINGKLKIMHSMHDYTDMLNASVVELNNLVEVFEQYGSGWKLQKVKGCDIRIADLPYLGGSCYIDLPKALSSKKCLINVRNNDDQCFMWAFLSVAHYDDVKGHRGRVTQYKRFAEKYDFSGISFPTEIKDVDKFNSNNSHRKLCVNVFGLETTYNMYGEKIIRVVMVRMAKNCLDSKFKKINLLLIDDESTCQRHYVGIANISRLFGKATKSKKFVCYNCLNLIPKKTYKKHNKTCYNFKSQQIVIPARSKDPQCNVEIKNFIQFSSHEKLMKHEFVIYVDFEALNEPTAKLILPTLTQKCYHSIYQVVTHTPL
ncbi:unnamed protein product [Orchesella dallaii]|uniref:C2H2-type domain-containing protein n=1 Tax=Orchesella dallaii TaxID=48710 RepID=A0ABP1RJZ8_9HEXA